MSISSRWVRLGAIAIVLSSAVFSALSCGKTAAGGGTSSRLSGKWVLDLKRSTGARGSALPLIVGSVFIEFRKSGDLNVWTNGAWLTGTYSVKGSQVLVNPASEVAPAWYGMFTGGPVRKEPIVWSLKDDGEIVEAQVIGRPGSTLVFVKQSPH